MSYHHWAAPSSPTIVFVHVRLVLDAPAVTHMLSVLRLVVLMGTIFFDRVLAVAILRCSSRSSLPTLRNGHPLSSNPSVLRPSLSVLHLLYPHRDEPTSLSSHLSFIDCGWDLLPDLTL